MGQVASCTDEATCWDWRDPAQMTVDEVPKFGLGIMWLVRNDKLIVAGFDPDSSARKAGLECGDILKEVNGVEVINEKLDVQGRHSAGEMMLGEQGTYCHLKVLRITKSPESEHTPEPKHVQLVEVSASVVRRVPAAHRPLVGASA